MIRLAIFVIALLLAVDAAEPSKALLITLAVLTGIELFRLPWWPRFRMPRAWSRRDWSRSDWMEFDW